MGHFQSIGVCVCVLVNSVVDHLLQNNFQELANDLQPISTFAAFGMATLNRIIFKTEYYKKKKKISLSGIETKNERQK